ncbi:MAG: transcriptional regulator, partial [Chthoniobacterales bacterium]
MGRQWLHAKREVAGLKKGQATGKLVKEIMVASKMGGADPNGNARLFAAVEK